ncbi:YggS family pyridoxal phosphate-dependent enzyme [Thermomonospora catenispora]|uniref:YggS family pyridoxal phosphate-dependent enzyme n=1 Tax=Thermomonospora catenispora TaxID=2493090 RepID=UPI001120DFA9|nr:YggS family pyridoxal phosphate-dependent enzyme [Thermomonospora catenispora]TNY34745.1 YggS family pyridoxal phosphate-dependent enzyme [Thermomonospora catenispora]
MGPAGAVRTRRDELAANLRRVRERIAAACAAADRDPAEITLVAVTKTFPASDVRLLAELGVTDVGENRDQEAAGKAAECGDLPLTWHFVGQLQTNKARSVARYADVVHSVDRARLVTALSSAATRAGRSLRCLVQVSLDDRPGRGGAAPDEAPALADAIAASEGLELAGVMAVAPLGADPAPAFARLADVAERLRAAHPSATVISAGMSGDLEQAIACGATHVRIGTALLGGRGAIVR